MENLLSCIKLEQYKGQTSSVTTFTITFVFSIEYGAFLIFSSLNKTQNEEIAVIFSRSITTEKYSA